MIILDENNVLKGLNNIVEQVFSRSKQLSNEDFDKFLYNIEVIKRITVQQKRRDSNYKLMEDSKEDSKPINFRDFFKGK